MAESFEILPGEDLEKVLRRASAYLASAGVENPRVDAELLAAHCLSRSKGEYISRGRVQSLALLGESVPEKLAELLSLRAQRIPLQHLTGVAYFRHLELKVGPGVFVPRPETEELVSRVVREIDRRSAPLKIADLCTGSGAIAASIAFERSGHTVKAVELSELALAWTAQNLAGTHVELVGADATTAFAGEEDTFDIIASNPPYIPQNAVPKDLEVREHDPAMALFGGSDDGLKIPRAICQRASALLKPAGFLIMEHAETQRQAMREILAENGFENIESIDDLAGSARHTAGYKKSK